MPRLVPFRESIRVRNPVLELSGMVSFNEFLGLYISSLVVAMLVGLLLVVGYRNLFLRKILSSLRYNSIYILFMVALPVIIIVFFDLLAPSNPRSIVRENVYTNWMFQIAGGTIRVLQERLNYRVFTDFFVVAYVWAFAYITFFSPMLLLAKDDRANLRRYAIAMILNYLILIPFYVLFPVSVTGTYPESGVTPLLYVSTHWGRMVTSIDPLNNGFPSGHTSLCVVTLLVFAMAGPAYRRYVYFLAGATASIVFSVLYLGIHWPFDIFVGFLLAVFVVAVSGIDRIQMTIDRYVRRLTVMLFCEAEVPESDGERPRS